ncbi:uncharacterized protein LOC116163261 [Photinus pyralis]|uniref:uncharacterized protein LOC116163261 n=1 Tax=Photinus pyralis TaxID=7054 RepID=UPI0012674AEC|nr:uncharacterized protein LOC116163261 [Photinus pyralis]
MEDEENVKMLDHLQKYVPHLEKLISQLKDPKKKNKELQLSKLEGLLSMITDRKKKLKLDTLKKCEDVILKILQKVHPTIYKQIEQTDQRGGMPYTKFLCKTPPGEINPLAENEELKTARLQAARARLNEYSTPASPSPPRDVSIITPPVVIPTEKVPRKPNPDDFMIKSWDHTFEKRSSHSNSEHYKTDKPDIYRRAAESLTANLNKKPVFERLGTRVDMSVPPLSAEDLMQLTESDSVTVTDLEHVRDDLKKKLSQEEGKCHIPDLRMKLTRDRQKEHNKSQSSSKPRTEKVFKDPDSKFGSLLSSIDDQILEKKDTSKKDEKRSRSDKDRERDKHKHKSKKRDRSKERRRSKDRKHHDKDRDKDKDKPKDKKEESSKKETVKKESEKKDTVKEKIVEKVKVEVPEKPVFKRLADKYNPRPRKNSIEVVERPPEIPIKEAVPSVNKDAILSTVKSNLLRSIDETLLCNVKEVLLSNKDTLTRNPIASPVDKLTATMKEIKSDNDQYLTSIRDTYCPPKPIKDIVGSTNQIEKFAGTVAKEAKKDNEQYLTTIKDTYYPPKPVNEMWSPSYGMMPQTTMEFIPPVTTKRAGNTYLNTFIVHNNVSSHGQYTQPSSSFPPKPFHPYDPLPSPNHYESNQQQLDYYSHNQRPNYQNRPYQQQYSRDRQLTDVWSSDRQQPDNWNNSDNTWNQQSDATWTQDRQPSENAWSQEPRQHSDNWNLDPRTAARPSTFNRDPRIRQREEKESTQKMVFVPPPSQTKRRSVDDYPTYGQSRYDMMYNQDRIKNEETFTSPLNSLYTTGNDSQRTGKGYGVQKFRIPKKKMETEEPKTEECPKPADEDNVDECVPNDRDIDEPTDVTQEEQSEAIPETVAPKEPVEEKEPEPAKASVAEQAMLTNFFSDFVKNPNSKTILNAILCSMADNTGDKSKYKQILAIMNSDGNEEEEKSQAETDDKDKLSEITEPVTEQAEVVPKQTGKKTGYRNRRKKQIAKKVRLRKSRRNKLKAAKKAALAKAAITKQSDTVIETVGERIKNRKRNIPAPDPPKVRCTELDRLHNDIKEMFICDGVLTATGKRMCRILKSDSSSDKESPDLSKSKEDDATVLDSPKRRARASNPKVLIEKTDLSKLVSTKASSDSDSEPESPVTRRASRRRLLDLDSTPEPVPPKPVSARALLKRTSKIKPNYTEPSEDDIQLPKSPKPVEKKEVVEEKEPAPEKSVEKKGIKKKRRGHNWAVGVINKRIVKKKASVEEPETVAAEVPEPPAKEEKPKTNEHDTSYYVDSAEKSDCRLCPFKGKFIVHHYRTVHPQHEVLISRVSPENGQKAIEESTENNYEEVEPVHIFEAKNRKKRFTYQCRFCQAVYKNEHAETFFDHLTSHTGEYRFHCGMCNFKTSNGRALRSHKYSAHQACTEPPGPKPPVYPPPPNFSLVFGYLCETCNFVQMDKSAMETHVENHHQGANIFKVNMSTVISNPVKESAPEVEESAPIENAPEPESEKVPETVVEQPPEPVEPEKLVEKPKEEDPTVFKSNPDDSTENLMEEQKHEKMLEISQAVIPKKKLSFDLLDRIKSRLDSKTAEENETEVETATQMEEEEEAIVSPQRTLSPLSSIKTDSTFNEDPQPIANVIGKMAVDSQPPPLIPINEFPIALKAEEIGVQVGPILARKKQDYILYMCYVQSCMFSSTNGEEFEIHCKTFHHNKQWDGVCNLCDLQTGQSEIEDAYNHLVSTHGSELGIERKPDMEVKSTYLRMRRLSGDMLSEQKPLVTLSEETPFKIVDVQTQQEESEDESFSFPFQIANVTTLTPEEDQALNSPAPISIVTQSLVTPPLSTLTVIAASGSSTNVTSSTALPSYNILVPYIPPLVTTSSPKKPTTPVLVPLSKTNAVPTQSPSPPKPSTSKKVVLKDVPLQAYELIASRKTKTATRILLTEQKLIHLYKCPEMSCPFSTDTKRLFEVHLQQHPEYKPGTQISCLYCNFKVDYRMFAVHCDVRHGRCQFCCNYCFYRAINQSYVEMHQEREHPRNKRRVLRAPINSDALTSQANITLPPIKSIVPLYICGMPGCHETKFIFYKDFSNHCMSVHGASTISCYHCMYIPTNGNDAATHMQMHNVCHYHCRYCLYGGHTLEEVHNHLSLQHFAFIPRIIERRFMPDATNKPSSDYKWDDPKSYDRLHILTTELTKYVTPVALIEVISYAPKPKTIISVVKTVPSSEKKETITMYKAPLVSQAKKSAAVEDKAKPSTTKVGDSTPIVLNNFLQSQVDLMSITRCVSKAKGEDKCPHAANATIPTDIPPLSVAQPEAIRVDERSFDDTRQETSDGPLEQDPLQVRSEPGTSTPKSTDSVSLPSQSPQDFSSFSTLTEDELSDFTVTSEGKSAKIRDLTGKDLFQCSICRESFDRASQFKGHMLKCVETHRLGVTKPYECCHCLKMFKTLHSLMEHLRSHGTKRFTCSLCDFKHSHQFHVRAHMKVRHNVNNATMVPVNAQETNIDEDEFVLKPKINRQKSFESAIPKDSQSATIDVVLKFGPEDVDALPLREIYSKEVKCSVCGYATKVRTNLIRHFQFHKIGKEVPIPAIAPVNPVPCLDKNEKMFDKMFNLSISSYNDALRNPLKTDKKELPKITKEEEIELPTYVPVTKRYVCGADNCDYLCLEESMLRSHLQALHSDETSYKCIHCNEVLHKAKGVINIDQILKHFRLHDLNLYKCSYCKFLHNLKHKVDRHVLDKHPNNTPLVIIIREMDHEPEEATHHHHHVQEDVKEAKPWRCGMCKYRCSTKTEIVTHAHNKHELDTQFKCALCQYRTSTKSNFADHFQTEHPGRNVDVIDAYYEEEAIPALKNIAELSMFDTTPIWQREKTKLKYIRGIPIVEETSKPSKKSPLKFDDKAEIKKIATTPSKKPKTLKEKKLELIIKVGDVEVIEIEDDDVLVIDEKPKVSEKQPVLSESASQSDQDKVGSSGYTLEDLMSMDITTLKNANLSCASYGPFGVPRNRQYLCPICNSFKTKKEEDIKNHLYKHHDYHKFVCTICKLTGISYKFLKRHSGRKHQGLPEAIYPMTPAPLIEDWVRKVLAVQSRIMEENESMATVSSTTVHDVIKTEDSPKRQVTTEINAADSSSTLGRSKVIQQCQHCSYSCRAASDMRKHERRHWLQKPLRCGHCDFEGKFFRNFLFLLHS